MLPQPIASIASIAQSATEPHHVFHIAFIITPPFNPHANLTKTPPGQTSETKSELSPSEHATSQGRAAKRRAQNTSVGVPGTYVGRCALTRCAAVKVPG